MQENVNTDANISIVGFGDVRVEGFKMTIFRCLETLEGTFVRKHMSQSCLGACWKCSEWFICRKPGYRPQNVVLTYFWGWESVRVEGRK